MKCELHFLIGFVIACITYVLGKKGYLSEYMYISFNFGKLSKKEIEDYSRRRYNSAYWMDPSNTIWAYIQLIICMTFWPIVLPSLGIIYILNKLIKEKKNKEF